MDNLVQPMIYAMLLSLFNSGLVLKIDRPDLMVFKQNIHAFLKIGNFVHH